MSKLLADATCPGCNKSHQVEVDLDSIPKATRARLVEDVQPITSKDIEEMFDKKLKDLKPLEVSKEPAKKKDEITLQSHVPGYKCKNCGDAHPNKGYRKKVKHRCTGDRGDGEECGQYSPDGKGKCPWCGKVDEYEELDDDALENMPQPKEMEHDHEHE